jgi:hypothetical protein
MKNSRPQIVKKISMEAIIKFRLTLLILTMPGMMKNQIKIVAARKIFKKIQMN